MDSKTLTLETVRDSIPDYARDLKLNLGSVLTPTGAPGLNERQIWSVALASAIASRNNAFTRVIEAAAGAQLDAAHLGELLVGEHRAREFEAAAITGARIEQVALTTQPHVASCTWWRMRSTRLCRHGCA